MVSLPRMLILLLVILSIGVYSSLVKAGPYKDSAHGNSSYGVYRTSTANLGYVKGNCAHCHEQHACIAGNEPDPQSGSPSPYALFADNFVSQSEDFCFYCHRGTGSVQVSFARKNYNYSYWFGGDTVHHTTSDNIYDVFNPTNGSSHNLQDILNFVKTKWPNTFGNESNPCNACHNPHLSQRNYPIVRPTDRNNIWGDEPGERMSDYAAAHGGQYQAPYRYDSGYEPDGSTTTDGSNLPDYVTFCTDCHNDTNVIYSTTLGRYLKKINWSNPNRTYGLTGDYHGSITRCFGVDGNPDPDLNWGSLKDPYHTVNYTNFILSCTDCHEVHGAVNGYNTTTPYFLRKTVNGHYNQYPPGPGPWTWEREFCLSCHVHNNHCGGYGSCFNCHYHNAYNRCWA
ncbi:MAG: hypothetical protein J7M03_04995 [Candidatus Desulfofervidaceae bacterium]|nr:hypothetical protein [Candidatus Desulfofervidaceae bacterium]